MGYLWHAHSKLLEKGTVLIVHVVVVKSQRA